MTWEWDKWFEDLHLLSYTYCIRLADPKSQCTKHSPGPEGGKPRALLTPAKQGLKGCDRAPHTHITCCIPSRSVMRTLPDTAFSPPDARGEEGEGPTPRRTYESLTPAHPAWAKEILRMGWLVHMELCSAYVEARVRG